jgi:hypothetical protein
MVFLDGRLVGVGSSGASTWPIIKVQHRVAVERAHVT